MGPGSVKLAKLLVELGSSTIFKSSVVSGSEQGRSSAFVAARFDRADFLRFLLSDLALMEVLEARLQGGESVAHVAAYYDSLESISGMLDKKFSPSFVYYGQRYRSQEFVVHVYSS